MAGVHVAAVNGPVAETAVDMPRDTIVLTHAYRRSIWLLLFLVQLLSGALLAFFASIYFLGNTPNSMLWTAAVYFIDATGYDFVNTNSVLIAISYTLLSAAFVVNGLRLLGSSVRHRQLSFGTSTRRGLKVANPAHASRSSNKTTSGIVSSLLQRIRFIAEAVSIHGPLFEVRQIASEIVALGSQTSAAYLASHSVSNLGLNQTYGFVIFFNGVSTLVFARVFQNSPLKERFACLLADVVLDFVWGSLLPLWMYIPILNMFQLTVTEIRSDGESSVREMRRVFVLSWGSFLLSVFPFVNSLLTIFEVQTILRDDTVAPYSVSSDLKPKPVGTQRHQQRSWTKYAHALFALYGCVLLGISLWAGDIFSQVQHQPQYGCAFRLHPWFSTKEACIKRTIDCSAVGIGGNLTEMEAALDLVDESSLSDVTFVGCPAFEMPRTLGRFGSLNTIIIANSQIMGWSIDASLADDKIADVRILMLLDVDSNATLHGLVSVPIAKSIEYIRLHRVPHADTILAPVGTNWQHLMHLDCDRCFLTDVPHAVDAMYQLRTLSLVESHFAVLRDDYITKWNLALMAIWMDGSAQLTQLSDVVWKQAATCEVFSMQYTNLSVVPDWLPSVAHSQFVLLAHQTPLCDSSNGLLASAPASVRSLVECKFVDTNS